MIKLFFKKLIKIDPKLYYPQNEQEIWYRDTYVLWSYIYCFDWEFIGGCERDEFNKKDMKRMLSDYWFVENYNECIKVLSTLKRDGAENKDAWDLCRAMQLIACAYLANFYEREKLNELSLEVALLLQQCFNSWDEMVQSYLKGLEEWGVISLPEPEAYLILQERKSAYNILRTLKNPPYSVDWFLDLKV